MKLTPRQTEVIALRCGDGLHRKEIAAHLGIKDANRTRAFADRRAAHRAERVPGMRRLGSDAGGHGHQIGRGMKRTQRGMWWGLIRQTWRYRIRGVNSWR